MNWISIGSVSMALAVLLGAFGAHGLKGTLTEKYLEIYNTGVFYHLIHSLGLIIIGNLQKEKTKGSGIFLLAGILLFSGSLYLLAITGIKWLGLITPLGGISFIIGWLTLALAYRKISP